MENRGRVCVSVSLSLSIARRDLHTTFWRNAMRGQAKKEEEKIETDAGATSMAKQKDEDARPVGAFSSWYFFFGFLLLL